MLLSFNCSLSFEAQDIASEKGFGAIDRTLKNNIISIETNTDLFNEYNNEISKTIDKYWDIIDFDYDNYYGLMR